MKYIIDICDEPINHDEGSPQLYKAKNFNSLVFDEEELKRLTAYIEYPIPDNSFKEEEQAWALAARILLGYYSGSELIKMFGDDDPEHAITAYSYREAKIITEGYDNHKQIAEDVAKILEKRQQCLCRVEADNCICECSGCECHVTDDEMIKALVYAIPTLKEV